MANMNDKKGMLIDVQPLKSKQEVNELIEATRNEYKWFTKP